MRNFFKNFKGQSAIEFILLLPFMFFLLLTAIQTTFACIGGVTTQYSAMRAAREVAVYSGNGFKASFVGALSEGLSDQVLRGGDLPSPYCTKEKGYRVCDF